MSLEIPPPMVERIETLASQTRQTPDSVLIQALRIGLDALTE